jgi:hypothetical protein
LRWRSIKITEFERRQITAVRKELDQEHETQAGLKTQPSKDAAPVKISSSSRTWLAHEIATRGHASPREIARYTKSADQHQLAVTAMAQVKRNIEWPTWRTLSKKRENPWESKERTGMTIIRQTV